MPKPMYVWSGSAWVSVATEVESLAGFATQSYADNTPGMKLVVPTSVAVGSGSGSIATQGTVTFSGVSSVSLNGCFTSTYQNYKVIMDITNASSVLNNLRLRLSGTDASGSDYDIQINDLANGNKTTTLNTTALPLHYYGNSANGVVLDILKPKDAAITQFQGNSYIENGYCVFGAQHDEATSYDGFTIYPASSTMSGTIRVYGYKAG